MNARVAAVVGVHTNPFTCGIARFNSRLAEELGVSVVGWRTFSDSPTPGTLLSIKTSEFDDDAILQLDRFVSSGIEFDLFLHSFEGTTLEHALVRCARQLFVGSREMARQVCNVRPDVVTCFAPGMEPLGIISEVDIRLLTFGMAHKISSGGYRRLAELLRRDGRLSVLEISTALHEGTRFDSEFFAVADEIRAAFDGSVRFLGFLADEEVSQRLQRASAMVAFFPRGVRENNTSVMGALAHGCPVITNLDADSPPWLQHGVTCFDIASMATFPGEEVLTTVGRAGRKAVEAYSYSELARLLRG